MKNENKFRTGDVLLISAAHLFHDIFSSFLAPVLPLLIDKMSMSYSMAGSLTVFQRLASLFNPFVGIVADKIRVRYLLIIAPAVTAITMSLLGLAPSYLSLVILLTIMGISSTLFHVPAPVMIKRVAGDRTGAGMSLFMLGGELARSIGPLTILGAISLWGLEGTHRLIPCGIIASALLWVRLSKIRISSEFKRKKKEHGARETFVRLLPLFGAITGVMLSRAFMKAALTAFLPTYLTVQGDSIWIAGISLAIIQFSGAAGTFFWGAASDRIGRKPALLIVAIVSPVIMGVFLLFKGIYTIPLIVVLGFTLFAPTPVFLAMVQDINSDRPAFVNGIFMTINFTTASVAMIVVGFTGDTIGLEMTYRISAFLALGAIPFVFKFSDKNPD